MFELTQEISVLMDAYAEKTRESYSSEEAGEHYKLIRKLREDYSKAIELTCRDSCGGLIMPIDKAIDWVSHGSINDYDGIGEVLDSDGNKIKRMSCNVNFLKECKKDGACFIAWYNK